MVWIVSLVGQRRSCVSRKEDGLDIVNKMTSHSGCLSDCGMTNQIAQLLEDFIKNRLMRSGVLKILANERFQ